MTEKSLKEKLSLADKRTLKWIVENMTKTDWLELLFPTVRQNENEICGGCYSNPPYWSPDDDGVERCDYCGASKDENAVAPVGIPKTIAFVLMCKRLVGE